MQKTCAYCQKPFVALRNTRKYCSDNCKQMAYYKRNGFVLASHSGLNSSLREEDTVNDVKYDMQGAQTLELLLKVETATAPDLREEEKHPADLGSKSDNETKPGGIVKYDWIESSFLRRIESHLCSEYRDLSKYFITHKAECSKVLECFKCLIRNLVQLSNRSEVDRSTFIIVANTFTQLIRSPAFISLPKHFPYLQLILELEKKVSALAHAHKQSDVLRFRLSPDRKALLIAIRFELGAHIGDIKFNEISFLT